jgi:hypothetical protein
MPNLEKVARILAATQDGHRWAWCRSAYPRWWLEVGAQGGNVGLLQVEPEPQPRTAPEPCQGHGAAMEVDIDLDRCATERAPGWAVRIGCKMKSSRPSRPTS